MRFFCSSHPFHGFSLVGHDGAERFQHRHGGEVLAGDELDAADLSPHFWRSCVHTSYMYTWCIDSRRRVIDPAADSDTTPRGTDKDQEGARREHSSGSENRTTTTTAVSCFAILRGFETFPCPLCKGVAPGSAVHRTTFSIYPTIPLVPTNQLLMIGNPKRFSACRPNGCALNSRTKWAKLQHEEDRYKLPGR